MMEFDYCMLCETVGITTEICKGEIYCYECEGILEDYEKLRENTEDK